MGMWRSAVSGVRALLGRERRGAEIDEELRSFVDASVEDKVRCGMRREDAERAARVEAGSMAMVRHKVWAAGWESVAESVWQDVRFGVRQLVKSPGFSMVAILSLALGIGANTAIFTLINGLLLKSLPVREPGMLVSFGKAVGGGIVGGQRVGPVDLFSYEFYERIEKANRDVKGPFEGISGFASFPSMVSVRTGGGSSGAGNAPATLALVHLVSGNFFSVVGAEPVLGRALTPADADAPGRSAVAVISHRYWEQALAGDPNVVGRQITVNGVQFTVAGVMGASFYGVDLNEQTTDMWLPVTMQAEALQQPSLLGPGGLYWMHLMGRRKAGVSVAQAQAWTTAQLQQYFTDREGAQITEARRKEIARDFVEMEPGGAGISNLRAMYAAPLAVLMGIVGVVLLIACANLANFLLAKAAAREREFSTRMALGSSRGRIVRQILTETLLLSFTGGALGMLLAWWGTKALIAFMVGAQGNTALKATPDLNVLGFTSAICVLTGLLFGMAPALRVSRIGRAGIGGAGALNATVRTAAGGRQGKMLPRVLLTAQVALSLVLLAVAGLFLRTLHNLRSQDVGFERTNVLLVNTNPKFAGYKPEQLNALYGRLLDRLGALPGVKSATISGALPKARGNWGSPITIAGRTNGPNEDVSTLLNRVGPRYFETLGIPVIQGRGIGVEDTPSATHAVVVNQTLVKKYFKDGDAIGHSFTVADPSVKGTWTIVGVVKDAQYLQGDPDQEAMAYLAVEQLTEDDQYAYWLQLRTVGDPAAVGGEVRAAMAEIDGNLPILEMQTIGEQLDGLIDRERLISQLSGFFSALALLLACIGLYGVMTYNVVRRTNEIGIRLALGARTQGVLWMVLKESLVLLGVGLAVGIPATLAASRAVRAQLFGVTATDPATIGLAVLAISVVTIGAAYFPARRATRINPMVALRYE